MQIITIEEGQTLKDIAAQRLGDASRMFEIALLNGISTTVDLIIGASLMVPDAAIEKQKLVAEFVERKIIPASAILQTVELDPLDWDVFYGLYD